MVQSTLKLFKGEVRLMEEVKNFELGEKPIMLTRKWKLFNLSQMIKGEARINIFHKDLSVIMKEYFVNGSERDTIDFENLAFGLLGVDEMDKLFRKESFYNF